MTRVQPLLAVLVAALALAAPAPAATLDLDGGTLTYTGAAEAGDVDFTPTEEGEVRIDRDAGDADPLTGTLPPPGCTEDVAGDTYTCADVERIVATGGGGADVLDGSLLPGVPMSLAGGEGDDTLASGGADDDLDGGPGDDLVAGGGGDDLLVGDAGDDVVSGGPGYDVAAGPSGASASFIEISLDDVPGDRQSGAADEDDDVRSDVEAIDVELRSAEAGGDDVLSGNAGPNSIAGGRGDDVIDGLAGNDVLSGGGGDDAIAARDGFADVVSCGAGTDTVEADQFDVFEDCEVASIDDTGSATEDRPPTVALTAPAEGAVIGERGTTMAADARDDRGVSLVMFIDDDRIACTDSEPPYSCDYAPRGEDVGRNTLVAIAFDTAQQTASVTRTFRVRRFTPTLAATVSPTRDRRRPFRFVTTGRLNLPAGVEPETGCRGKVRVEVKAALRRIRLRRAKVRRNCQFASVVSFKRRKRFPRSGLLRFVARFAGSSVLMESLPVSHYVRTRR